MRRAVTKNHEYMKFMTIEDKFGTMEIVLFPGVYQRYGDRTYGYGPYVVHGRVEAKHNALTIIAERIDVLASEEETSLPVICEIN